MLWIALAASLSAPVPANLGDWFGNDDFPAYLVEQQPGVWLVGIGVTVGPDGAVTNCSVESSSGVPGLDELTCKTVRARAKFRPSVSESGSPTVGVYRTYVGWDVTKMPATTSHVSNAVLNLSVQSLPNGINSPAAVRVMFAVDQQGRIGSCAAEPTQPFERIDNNPALVSVACEQLAKSYKPKPASPSVQDAIVRFSIDSH
jgi:protein TonB